MLEEIKRYNKELVFDNYSRIVENCKDYEEITKVKMVEAIYEVYSDYNNIIDICTERELLYLKKIVEGKNVDELIGYNDLNYFENNYLRNKYLIFYNKGGYQVPEEIRENVLKALENVSYAEVRKKDKINEFLIGYCKVLGNCFSDKLIESASVTLDISKDDIIYHMNHNLLFRYFICGDEKYVEEVGFVPVAIYNDYYHLLKTIDENRRVYGVGESAEIDFEELKMIFYYDFDINKKIIKEFLEEVDNLNVLTTSVLEHVRFFALLNQKRDPLQNMIASIPALKDVDLSHFFEIMDKAMDEMPSGVLNGFSSNQIIKINKEKKAVASGFIKNYVKQKNACLSKSQAKLFYKLYFGLLEFTNRKYQLQSNFKIYNKKGLNPYNLTEIIEKFWEEKTEIIKEFCLENPYKFNNTELKLVKEFEKGFREIVIIVKYESEYTGILAYSKAYMIKGLNSNIDEVVPVASLPHVSRTSIIPFLGNIIYDGVLAHIDIDLDFNFKKLALEEYESSLKNYHL